MALRVSLRSIRVYAPYGKGIIVIEDITHDRKEKIGVGINIYLLLYSGLLMILS